VLKVGSDVAFILFQVLPLLKPGVLIHIHDMFWPFEYPKQWVLDGRAWNEDYAVRAFLQFNDHFEILFFNGYMAKFHSDQVGRKLPLCNQNPGGALWLRRTK
jgi:hypothetical protein